MNKKRFSLGVTIILVLMMTVFGAALTAQAATVCTPTSTVSVPYAQDGAGDFCFQTSDLCAYINSWNLSTLEVNGNPYTNVYVASSTIPPLNGMYIIHYVSTVSWGHFEIGGACSGGNPTPTWTNTNTPVPTITPTAPQGSLPDLTVVSMVTFKYNLPTPTPDAQGCYQPSSLERTGIRVTIQNIGSADAGAFVVYLSGSGVQQNISGLAAGQTLTVDYYAISFTSSRTATVDYTNLVTESDETNNSYTVTVFDVTATRTGTPAPLQCPSTLTPTPTITVTPTSPQGSVTGSVLIHGGGCCMGGPVGSVIGIDVAFSAASTAGTVTDMRVDHLSCGNAQDLSAASWEPFTTSQTYLHTIATINWYGYYTRAQYRDSVGNLSPIYCDDISIEGMPPVTVTGGTPTSSGPTRTPTPTLSPTPITPTPSGGTCSPVNATITAPFTKDGSGNLCWQSSNLGSYINSWNLVSLTVNGTNYTNVYASTSSLPAKIGGYWYVSYNSNVAWGHFEAK